MNLLLWRHATAEDGVDDLNRRLTKRGEKQAAQVAVWLQARLPAECRILVSPAMRTRQTADALARDYQVIPALAPGASAQEVLRVTGWPAAPGTVLVVGHQPTLGRVAALAITGTLGDWSVKKGGLWWLTNRDGEEGASALVRAVVTPELV
jgi:phosphohistidine phosphatase